MNQYIGKILDNRYEILDVIGVGGMAVVYKAYCHRLHRFVAIKILKRDLAADAEFRRRFHEEAQAVAMLSHPNIVSVYDVSKGDDLDYIVMELIDGITLKQYMQKKQGRLNWRESLYFITQIVRALGHAHSRGIIHRDIKPQNIMVLRDGSVKVADFGIARIMSAAQTTLTQEALGSVHYISPEQARGSHIDARADIYSAGVVLYEMLTGRLPFEGDSAVSVAIQHLSSIPLAPREINREIPEQLELICMKAMAPDPDRRYPSADAMIADLEAFRKNPGVSLDFELSDLRPEETDEPTQALRTSAVRGGAAAAHRQSLQRERRRDYYDDYDDNPPRRISTKQKVLIVVAVLLAAVLAVALIRSILASFTGTEEYGVPSLIGLTVEEAENRDDVAGIFEIREVGSEPSSKYSEGRIVRQDPDAGETRKGGGLIIQVWVSAGEDVGEMIDVTNMTVAQANVALRSLIEQYDLTVEAREEDEQYSDEYEADYIISTTPAEGEALKQGDTIYLVVSKGPEQITLPSFVGQQVDTVTSQSSTLGLNFTIVETPDDAPKGQIIDQNPAATTSVDKGSTVTLTVSSGPQEDNGEGGSTLYPGTDLLTIPLPSNTTSGYLRVMQDGEPIYRGQINCADLNWNFSIEISGSGETRIQAYLDDELFFDETYTIDGYYG